MSHNEHRYVSGGGLSLYYREYGSADHVVVCLPGLTRNSKDFDDLAEYLAGHGRRPWRVLCPDLRGRGRSDYDPRPANYHPGTYVRDIWTLLDGLGVQRCAIVGTSLGGLMAMIMAYQQPERVYGAVLNDVGPDIPPDAVDRILQYVGRIPPASDWEAAAEQTRLNYGLAFPGVPDDFWQGYVRRSWAENAEGQPAPDMDPAIGDAMRKAQGAVRVLRFLRRIKLVRRVHGVPIDLWDAFDALTMPCLLLQGALSDVLTDGIVNAMREHKPDLEVVRIPDRGHAPLLDEPIALAAIDDFLGRLV